MNAAMYWKGMRTTIQSVTRSCKACQINKRRTLKYGHLPPKSVISNPWECLCVDLIGLYTLKGRDTSQIDFMALTMIDPASSWFEIVELPLIKRLKTYSVNGKELLQAEDVFDKGLEVKLIENTLCVCKEGRLVIPKPLQRRAVLWYHHYLQMLQCTGKVCVPPSGE